jgi:predicted glutamine amidotransferase
LVIRDAVGQLYGWAVELGTHPPLLNFLLTNGRVFLAQRAGLELFFSSQKVSCADVGTCQEPDKVCLRFMPALRDALSTVSDGEPVRKVNHMLVASEPIGDEDIWEEIPDGSLIVLGPSMRLRVYAAHAQWLPCPSPPAPRARAVQGPRVRMFAVG